MAAAIERYHMGQETRIDPAPEVQEIAERLLRAYHQDLLEARFLSYFTTAAAPCTPQKCKPLMRYGFSKHIPNCPRASVDEGPDFLLLVNSEEWQVLLPTQREAKVDHFLNHLVRETTKDGGIKFVLIPHPFEDFPSVIARHGLYSHEATTMAQVMQQLSLDLDNTHTSSIDAVTISIPGAEPIAMTDAQFRAMVGREIGR
jgi:hypothetical protein